VRVFLLHTLSTLLYIIATHARAENRTALIAASKVVLNIHFYEHAELEAHRLMPLLVAGTCVVSEPSSDKQLDALFSSGVVFTEYNSLVSTTAALIHNDTARTLCQQHAKQLGTTLQQDVQPLIDLLSAAANRAIELSKMGS
jgi:hypothetical protein